MQNEAQRRRFSALLAETEDAVGEMAAAAGILRNRGLKFQLMLVLADAAELLAASDPEAAALALAEARDLASAMGAVTVTQRLDALDAATPEAAEA